MQSEKKTFCAICRHPSDEGEGHYKNCPVYTGETIEPVRGNPGIPQGLYQDQNQIQGGLAACASLASFSSQCPHCGGRDGMHYWAGTGQCPAIWSQTTRQGGPSTNVWPMQVRRWEDDGYEVAKIYRDARERLLEELKIQVEVNRRMAREIMDLRLEIQNLKGTLES